MLTDVSTSALTSAITSIEDVASHIENVFAEVGDRLGGGHAIFQELNEGLTSLAQELSGAKIEVAATALQDIARKLTGLADVLPSEGALLGAIGTNATKASTVLKPLIKQIQMVMTIARSGRIEAASLDASQESLLDFTQEAIDLARAVQASVDACTHDQVRLSEAIAVALNRQRDFETRYRGQLLSVSADLISAHSGMQSRQTESVQLAETTGANTKKMAEAVGKAIVSLQAGDSVRQRLEHVCRGLRLATGFDASIAPSATSDIQALVPSLICQLQAAQLKSAASEFGLDISDVDRSLKTLLSGAVDIVGYARALCGGQDGDMTSFLVIVKQALGQASELIGTCENSRKSVDDALLVVEDTLEKFRITISALSETIVDIILISMNAGLKAGQLGVKGRAFVVIANELKVTADHISGGAKMLKPILDAIKGSADGLKALRGEEESLQMVDMEPSILSAMQEIEAGNGQLGQLMARLEAEGTQFEDLMTRATATLSALGEKSAGLPAVARDLEFSGDNQKRLSVDDANAVAFTFDDLYAQYTMVSERDVHSQFSERVGLKSKPATLEVQNDTSDTDDVLFF